MLIIIESILSRFRCCFSRKAAFYWFVIIVLGFIIRCDHYGITSFIRWLFLNPECYDPMLRFFRATSWDLEMLLEHWVRIAIELNPIIEFNGRPLLIGDGIKVAKEAAKMPGVKSLHQESENSGKAEYILGHHFGFVGLLIGSLKKAFCLPLQGQLHEGIGAIHPAEGLNGKPPTLITRMAHLLVQKAKQTGRCCYATLDAYFAVGPSFLILKGFVNEKGQQWVHLITRAKDNTVAYFKSGSEAKFQEKDKVKLMDLFDSPELFTKAEVTIYGKTKSIHYYCVNLLWKPIKGLIRFVLVMDGKERYILMSSDLQLAPLQIITIYSYRSKIENMFLFLKHLLGGFYYHFWTKAFPKLKRGEKLDYTKLSPPAQQKFEQTVEAIEGFVNLAGIALGLLQHLSLIYTSEIWRSYYGWLRTYSSEFPSEGVAQNVVQAEFFFSRGKVPICRTLRRILKERSKHPLKLAI